MRGRFNRTQRNYIIIGLCAILVIMGVGYAAFSSQLKITGTSNIDSTWDVQITDIQSEVVSGSPTNEIEPTHDKLSATFHTKLYKPNDTMKYDITVSNLGSVDAKLDKINVPVNSSTAISYEVTGIKKGDLLKSNETALLTVTVKYNDVTSQPSQEELNINFNITLEYSQAPNGYEPPVTGPTVGGITIPLASEGDGLYADEYESGRFIYKGANPSNYITFNNETWRILSIEGDGRIKIVRDELPSARAWDSSGTFGSNNWDRPSDIKTYLNGEYLDSITVNKEKIVPSTWSIGAVTYGNNDLARQIAGENVTQSQSANVGLITVSEYLRANPNTELCGNYSLNNDNYSTCKTTNWLFKGSTYWTISPNAVSSSFVFLVYNDGIVNYNDAFDTNTVLPAITLSSDISLSGSGTVGDPYKIN